VFPLCLGKTLYWGDIALYFSPMLEFERTVLQAGKLPLWNPYILGGQPFVGNPQIGWLYPTNLLLPFVSVGNYLSLVSVLHLWLAGVWMRLYLRQRRLSETAALCGSLAFMGCDAVVSRLQFPPMVMAVCYLPLMLYAIDRLVARRDRWAMPILTLAFALCILAAHAQVTYLIVLTCLLYALMRILRCPRAVSFGYAGRILLCGMMGVWLCVPYLLPVIELLRHSPRQELTAANVDRFVMEPQHLMNFVVPHFTGHPAQGNYWGENTAWEPSCFMGWLPLIFAVLTLRIRRRFVWFWWAVASVSLWLSFGTSGGLFWIVYYAVPGISIFHDPARFLILVSFAIAVLCAVGVEDMLKRKAYLAIGNREIVPHEMKFLAEGAVAPNRAARSIRNWSACVLLGTALPIGLLAWQWNPAVREQGTGNRGQDNTQRLTYFPRYAQVWKPLITEGYRDYGADDEIFLHVLERSRLPNLNMNSGELSQSGYEPVPIRHATDFDGLLRLAFELGEPNFDVLLAARGVSAVITERGELLPLPETFGWLVRTLQRVDGNLRAAAAVTAPDFNPFQEAIVSDGLPANWQNQENEDEGTESVESIGKRPLDWKWRVNTGGKAAFLVMPLTYYVGWHAEVDGTPTAVYRTNLASMGVVVPAGSHEVVLRYEPQLFRIGVFLGGAAWSVFAAWMAALWRRKTIHR
jgi:hypothetical protein